MHTIFYIIYQNKEIVKRKVRNIELSVLKRYSHRIILSFLSIRYTENSTPLLPVLCTTYLPIRARSLAGHLKASFPVGSFPPTFPHTSIPSKFRKSSSSSSCVPNSFTTIHAFDLYALSAVHAIILVCE